MAATSNKQTITRRCLGCLRLFHNHAKFNLPLTFPAVARNRERGEDAVKQLEEEGLQPEFLPLDVDSEESIKSAKETVEKKYGRLDVLINNAGVLLRVSTQYMQASLTEKFPQGGDVFFIWIYESVTENV